MAHFLDVQELQVKVQSDGVFTAQRILKTL